MNETSSTPFRFVPWTSPQSPQSSLAFKRQRLSSEHSVLTAPSLLSAPFKYDATTNAIIANADDAKLSLPTVPSVPSPTPSVASLCPAPPHLDPMQAALMLIESESQAIRQRKVAQEQEDKQTKTSYGRHIKNYETWWNQTSHCLINLVPAFPITAAKVTLFLDYETTRPQASPFISDAPDFPHILSIEKAKGLENQ